MSARRRRRRRLQRSRRSLGGRHWSVAGSGRLRGSPRCGAVPRRASRRLRASRPRLSGSMLGLGSWARNWSWGWGAWLPLLRFSGQASPFPPDPRQLALWGVGHAACPTGLPGCSRVCPVAALGARGELGTRRFLGASRPRGISAGHTWPELRRRRRGTDWPSSAFRCGSRTWHAHLPPCLRGGVGEQLLLLPGAGVGAGGAPGCRGPCFGFSGHGRPDLEFRTPRSTQFQVFWGHGVLDRGQLSFSSFKYVVGKQVWQNFPLPSLLN